MATKTENKATETALNVYQKLLKARVQFLEAAPKKSGKHLQLEFKYFELEDIVPTATRIFSELGLLFVVKFTNDLAIGTIIDTDDDTAERIEFTSPMFEPEVIESKTGKQVTSKIQALGASQTYQRRYLYMLALDVVENDQVDGTPTETDKGKKKTVSTPKAPVTEEKRTEIKDDLVGKEEQANELQIRALKDSLKKLRELDSTQEDFIQKIALKTDKFTKIKKKACEDLILGIHDMLEAYSAKAAKKED